jgi:hypothetical protein
MSQSPEESERPSPRPARWQRMKAKVKASITWLRAHPMMLGIACVFLLSLLARIGLGQYHVNIQVAQSRAVLDLPSIDNQALANALKEEKDHRHHASPSPAAPAPVSFLRPHGRDRNQAGRRFSPPHRNQPHHSKPVEAPGKKGWKSRASASAVERP